MNAAGEQLRLRCPHCRQGIVTVPLDRERRTDLICPACGEQASEPTALERLAADVEKSLQEVIAAVDRPRRDTRPPEGRES